MKTGKWYGAAFLAWAATAFTGPTALSVGAAEIALQTEASKGKRSVWDGLYTEAQAKRGEDQYSYYCGSCHISDLQGDSVQDVPPLAGEDFIAAWDKRTVGELFEVISKTMPKDSPASLDTKTYGDILSYVFQVNKFPTGPAELDPQPDRLAQTVIEGPRATPK
jgi:mono/diheme cytochrome c family protein